MAQVTRYVDTDVIGGAGNGTSWANAYASMAAWQTAEATDLVTATDNHVCYCRGVADEVGAIVIDGWETSAAYDLKIFGNNVSGVWDTNKYTITAAGGYSAPTLRYQTDYVTLRNLQVETTGTDRASAIRGPEDSGGPFITPTNNLIIIDGNICRATNLWKYAQESDLACGIAERFVDDINIEITNNVIYGFGSSTTGGVGILVVDFSSDRVLIANNTIYDCNEGISTYWENSNWRVVNNIIDVAITPFLYQSSAYHDYNIVTSGTNPGANSVQGTLEFHNTSIRSLYPVDVDLHLLSALDLSSDFTNYYTGETRATWIKGALPVYVKVEPLTYETPLYGNSVKAFTQSSTDTLSTASFAVGGEDRFLFAAVLSGAGGGAVEPLAVKWGGSGGQSLTQIGPTVSQGSNVKFSLWGLVAPVAQTSTGYVELVGAQDEVGIIFCSYTGVNQANPLGTTASFSNTTGTDEAAVPVASAPRDLIIAIGGSGDNTDSNASLSADGTQIPRQEIEGSEMSYEVLGLSELEATALSTTVGYTLSVGVAFGIGVLGVALKGILTPRTEFFKITVPWTSQPPAGTPIDFGNKLTHGLVAAYVPHGNKMIDVLGGGLDLVAGAGTPAAGAGYMGRSVNMTSGGSDYLVTAQTVSTDNLRKPSTGVSVLAFMQPRESWDTSTNRPFWRMERPGFWNSYGWRMDGPQWDWRVNNGAAMANGIYSDLENRFYLPTVMVGRWSATYNGGTSNARLYSYISKRRTDGTGTGEGTGTTTGPITYDDGGTGTRLYVGGDDTNLGLVNGESFLSLIYDRRLSDDEVQDLVDNPWQIFKPREILLPVVEPTYHLIPIQIPHKGQPQ